MKRFIIIRLTLFMFFLVSFASKTPIYAQVQGDNPRNTNFVKKIKFGGGLGLGFGSGYTDIMVAPSAIYQIDDMFAVGIGLQGNYVENKNHYSSFMYGGSLIGLINPIPEIQISGELEQLRVNNTYKMIEGPDYKHDFWNTALFLGAGYNSGIVTVGIRYNVLYKKKNNVYGGAYMPFIRVYF